MPHFEALIVSPSRLQADGLDVLLRALPGVRVVGIATTYQRARELAASSRPAVILIDVSHGDLLQYVEGFRQACEARIIAFGVGPNDRDLLSCARASVNGVCHNAATVDELVSVVEYALRGHVKLSPEMGSALFRRLIMGGGGPTRARLGVPLTDREADVYTLLCQGLSNKAIARQLHISIATVKNHVHAVLMKLGVGRRAEAMLWATHTDDASMADRA
jgi:DNA-binding NarL/FixJ family response regulator